MYKYIDYFNGSFCEFRTIDFNKRINFATGKDVKIGIIDSGWDLSLTDKRIKKGIGLVDPGDELLLFKSADYKDINGHGTACTDIILRIAPDAEIYPIKVFGQKIETSVNILIEGILWAISNGIKVLNISLGTLLPESLEPLYIACEKAKRNGLILVAAKSNLDDTSYPAIFENVIGVEVLNIDDIFKFEMRMDEGIECKAKGQYSNICGLGGYRINLVGNSFAAPVISGIIALFIDNHPELNLEQIRKILHKFANI